LKLSFVIFSFGILLMFMYELVYSVIRIIYTYVSRKKRDRQYFGHKFDKFKCVVLIKCEKYHEGIHDDDDDDDEGNAKLY